jgi:hypothetical protein
MIVTKIVNRVSDLSIGVPCCVSKEIEDGRRLPVVRTGYS